MPILKQEADVFPSHLFDLSWDKEPWWTAHVRSRQEKVLARHLLQCGVGYYLPQEQKKVKKASRTLVSHLPLFSGYLFFRGAHAERRAALQSNVIVNVLTVHDQPLLHRELSELYRLQISGAELHPHPYVAPGDLVKVASGPFSGMTGIVLREKGSLRLVVSVTFIQRSVLAEFDRAVLEPAVASRG